MDTTRKQWVIDNYHRLWEEEGILPKQMAEKSGFSLRYIYDLIHIVAKNNNVKDYRIYLQIPHREHTCRGKNNDSRKCEKINFEELRESFDSAKNALDSTATKIKNIQKEIMMEE